jgi:hypothetical protein
MKMHLPTVLVIAAILLFAKPAMATTPEYGYGRYSYFSKGLSIQFEWNLRGVEKVKINGKTVTEAKSCEDTDPIAANFGSSGAYPCSFSFEVGTTTIRLDLVLVLNEYKLVRVGGVYSEWRNGKLKLSRVVEMKVKPLEE